MGLGVNYAALIYRCIRPKPITTVTATVLLVPVIGSAVSVYTQLAAELFMHSPI